MKAYKYKTRVYASDMDWIHGIGQTQTRIYIPNRAVFGFRDNEQIDFFSEKPEAIEEAKKIVKRKSKKDCAYLGKIEIPDTTFNNLVMTARILNQAKIRFNKVSKSLLDALK